MLIQRDNLTLKILEFFKEQQRFKQRFDIWYYFCNDENVYKVDFRIQMLVCNDDKYEKSNKND